MGVIIQPGYTKPIADQPLTHARIAHSGNWYSGGTAFATSTDAAFFTDGPLNSLTFEKWKPSADPSYWEYDHGSSVTADYMCVGAHTLGTAGSVFKLEYYDGAAWVDVSSSISPTDDMDIFCIFEPVAARWWRIRITATVDFPTVGVFRVGQALQMPRPLYGGHSPLDLGRDIVTRSNMSSRGEFLGFTKQRAIMSTNIAWQNLTAQWVRDNWRDLQTAIQTEPFFIAWRPETFSEVGFCYTNKTPKPQNMGVRDLMDVSIDLTARAYD